MAHMARKQKLRLSHLHVYTILFLALVACQINFLEKKKIDFTNVFFN
jgi:hypothetical protein